MRAAIYTRYSSENQREASLEDQERLCRQEADRGGFTVLRVFKDAALSGAMTEQRPGFQAMMDTAKRKEFDVLIVDDSSRLSRDTSDAARILQRLQFWGVHLIARSDGVNTVQNPKSSLLIFGIKAATNAEFLRDLAEKTHRGLEGRARNGYSAGGLPYGYRSQPVTDERGRVVGYRRLIYEPEAEIVRRIFRLYVGEEGGEPHSPRQIAHLLNREKVAPPGARWEKRTVRQATSWSFTAIIGHRRLRKGILHNTLYIGKQTWNRSKWLRDPDTKAYTYRVRPLDDWVETDAPDLRIIPQALWDRAQVRLALLTTAPSGKSHYKGKYLLSGLLRCGVCGGSYSIRTPYSYACSTNHTRGTTQCTNEVHAPRVRLEGRILEALRDDIYTPEKIGELVGQVRTRLLARANTTAPQTGVNEKRLRQLDREIENVKKAVKSGRATESLLAMLEEIEQERKQLLAQTPTPQTEDHLSRLQRTLDTLPERIQGLLNDLQLLLADKQVDGGRAILAALGAAVTLTPNGDKLIAHVKGSAEKVLSLVATKGSKEVQICWLGEEDSNPR